MLVLALPSAYFREAFSSIFPSPSPAFYPIPSLPSPLQWRSPSAALSSVIRPQSPGSVRVLHHAVQQRVTFAASCSADSSVLSPSLRSHYPHSPTPPRPPPVSHPHQPLYPSAHPPTLHSIALPRSPEPARSLSPFAYLPPPVSAPPRSPLLQVPCTMFRPLSHRTPPQSLTLFAGACAHLPRSAFAAALHCDDQSCGLPPPLQPLRSMTDTALSAYMANSLSDGVFALALSSALSHATLASKRHVLDLGCGGACWSLLLAGPRLHVTVVVSSAAAHVLALRMVYALNAREHVTVVQSSDVSSASSFLSVLGSTVALQDEGFMGFEMVVILDLLSRLPAALVDDLSAALRPYMHTRCKALVSVQGMPAASEHSATEWCVCSRLHLALASCLCLDTLLAHVQPLRVGCRYEPDRLEAAMAALSASVLWCGVAASDAVSAAAGPGNGVNGRSRDAQEAREFRCSGCNIMELILAGSHRMALKSPVQQLQWTHEDFVSCDGNNATERPGACGSKAIMSHVEEFAARRGLMRMLQQEDHEVFQSMSDWRSAPSATFAPGWFFSEAFDGRLLLLPFYHRAQAAAQPADDVTLLLHMDASRLKNLEHAVTSWAGPVSVVVIVYVAARARWFMLRIMAAHTCPRRYAANAGFTIESIASLLQSSHAVAARASIHLARFAHSPEHYPVNVRLPLTLPAQTQRM